MAAALAVPWLDHRPASPAASLVDIHGVAPRQVKSQGFQLSSTARRSTSMPSASRAEAEHGTLTLLKAMWDGKRPPRPWAANAWIIDLAEPSRGVGVERGADHRAAVGTRRNSAER